MRIYTDASTYREKGISGLGFIVTDAKNNQIYQASSVVQEKDNNTAELRAILYALSSVKDTKEHITLLTDSTYAINAIRNNKYRESEIKLIYYIHQRLSSLNCTLFWLKGHANDGTVLSYYNGKVDTLAKNSVKRYLYQKIEKNKEKTRKNKKNKYLHLKKRKERD